MTRRIDEQPISLYARWLGIFFLSLIVGTLQLGALGSLLKMIALIPVAIWLFSRQPVRFSKTIICAFLFVVWIFLTCIWSIDPPASLS
ncbi:MAG: hypothetical protein IKI63_02950, partial [Clostridia bacterium]|nr:hypothetical protein [Clostridia bacterium]